MYSNSIFKALRLAAGSNSRKLGIAYTYALMKGRERHNYSKDPLVDEGTNVYIGIDTMGAYTLMHFEDNYIDVIKNQLNVNGYSPAQGTVEEVVIGILQKDFDEGLKRIGESLKKLVVLQRPNLQKGIGGITAGYIQREEQKAIRAELSQHLK